MAGKKRKRRRRVHIKRVVTFLLFPVLLVAVCIGFLVLTDTAGRQSKSRAEGTPNVMPRPFDGKLDEDEVGNGIPLLMQWDGRWGKTAYGDSDIAISGCGPTCVSMVAAGLTGDVKITPVLVAEYSERNGYYDSENGTSWALIREGVGAFGLWSEELPLDEAMMKAALEAGRPIICSMGKGDFTTTGHFIVLVGVREGKFQVHDPNSEERSHELWDYETLAPQIRNLWAIQKE